MSKELASVAGKGLTAFLDEQDDAFISAGREDGGLSGDILKFSGNTGKFTVRGDEITAGTRLAFNMAYVEWGKVCWKDGKLLERRFVEIAGGGRRPSDSELTDHGPYKPGEGWQDAYQVQVHDIEDGSAYQLMLSSKSGVAAMGRLVKEYGEKRRFNYDANRQPKIPIVEIDSVGFQPKQAPGTKYAPKFEIVDWLSGDEIQALIGGVGDVEDEGDEAAAEVAAEVPVEVVAEAPKKPQGVVRPAGVGLNKFKK
jgi:hypothetical protein